MRQALQDLYFNPRRPRRKPWYVLNSHTTAEVSAITGVKLYKLREQQLLLAMADAKNKMIAGHFRYSRLAYEHYRGNTLFMTILRDPVSRFISEYFYNRYKHNDHFRIKCDLDNYINSEIALRQSQLYLSWFTDTQSKSVGQYQQAISNINNIDIIGTVEDMPRLVKALEQRLDRKISMPIVRKNPRNHYQQEVSAVQRKKIEVMCADDINFYNDVCRLMN